MCTVPGSIDWRVTWEVTAWVLEIFFDCRRGPLQHVHEVHVPAEVQLVGLVDRHAPVLHEAGQDAVHDRGADLRLDVVADDRHAGGLEAGGPLRVRRR